MTRKVLEIEQDEDDDVEFQGETDENRGHSNVLNVF